MYSDACGVLHNRWGALRRGQGAAHHLDAHSVHVVAGVLVYGRREIRQARTQAHIYLSDRPGDTDESESGACSGMWVGVRGMPDARLLLSWEKTPHPYDHLLCSCTS